VNISIQNACLAYLLDKRAKREAPPSRAALRTMSKNRLPPWNRGPVSLRERFPGQDSKEKVGAGRQSSVYSLGTIGKPRSALLFVSVLQTALHSTKSSLSTMEAEPRRSRRYQTVCDLMATKWKRSKKTNQGPKRRPDLETAPRAAQFLKKSFSERHVS
jgi:hypothetical protein